MEAGYSVGRGETDERKCEQEGEMTFGDSGAQCRSARRQPGEVCIASQDGGIVGFGFRPELSLRPAG